ncbi:hypothetical protein CDCA_CDCA11G3132 [Cyanidium caldarium]|uniref:Myb-like domain-containing protein n=1 Tax=Cyanidium caldarium TaxID=2771 RepID=A0AAV9IXP8_CYACA|nr:hypothetical protein CDCA_CDCA11G3132 [Cyanidium caldarium]
MPSPLSTSLFGAVAARARLIPALDSLASQRRPLTGSTENASNSTAKQPRTPNGKSRARPRAPPQAEVDAVTSWLQRGLDFGRPDPGVASKTTSALTDPPTPTTAQEAELGREALCELLQLTRTRSVPVSDTAGLATSPAPGGPSEGATPSRGRRLKVDKCDWEFEDYLATARSMKSWTRRFLTRTIVPTTPKGKRNAPGRKTAAGAADAEAIPAWLRLVEEAFPPRTPKAAATNRNGEEAASPTASDCVAPKPQRPGGRGNPWSAAEDRLLMQLFQETNGCWSTISQRLSGRTPYGCRDRFQRLVGLKD